MAEWQSHAWINWQRSVYYFASACRIAPGTAIVGGRRDWQNCYEEGDSTVYVQNTINKKTTFCNHQSESIQIKICIKMTLE